MSWAEDEGYDAWDGETVWVARKDTRPIVECPACSGTGKFRSAFGTAPICYKCQGTGKVRGLKMDPQSVSRREYGRRRLEKLKAEAESRVDVYAAQKPSEAAWLRSHPENEFAVSVLRYIKKHGAPTPAQERAIVKSLRRSR